MTDDYKKTLRWLIVLQHLLEEMQVKCCLHVARLLWSFCNTSQL